MTEKKFLQEVMKKSMPDKEQIRRNCLQQESKRGMKIGWGRRLTTAAACVMAVVFVGTGVCYAATGESPIRLFRALFNSSDSHAVAQMEEGFVESNTVFEFDNLQFTFEHYFFDEGQGVILAEMMLETKDGSPIISWEEAYEEAQNDGEVSVVASSAEQWKKVCREDEEQYQIYSDICESLLTENILLEWPLDGATSMYSVQIEDEGRWRIYELVVENAINEQESDVNTDTDQDLTEKKQSSLMRIVYQDKIVGEVSMGNTGTLRSRGVDERKILNCTKISLTGAYMQMRFHNDSDNSDSSDFEIPFDKFEITMKDGYIYQWADNAWVFDQEPGTERILTEAEEKALEDEKGVTKIRNYGISYNVQGNSVVLFHFPEFINVDDIVSVTIDGVECLK